MSVFADLPAELWKVVMQCVPLNQRLSSCALVCQKFHAAAVAATECIEATLQGQLAVDSCVEYLKQYGSRLTSITLTGDEIGPDIWPVLLEQLPCPQLLELHLNTLDFKLDSDEDRPGLLSSTTALTRVELNHNALTSGGLAALADLPHLQHLSVAYLQMQADTPDKESAFAWASLQHLTHLGLFGGPVEAGSLRHISSMTSLRMLKVAGADCRLLASVAPGASLPPALQHFEFSGVIGPSALSAATQLTHLNLAGARVEGEGGVSGGMFLLEWLPKLQHLDYLSLFATEVDWPAPSPTFQPLVASCSKLRALDIGECDGALAHMFPPTLSHNVVLTSLEVLKAPDAVQDVVQLVRRCPALVHLAIKAQGGAHLTALSQLSALTILFLSLLPGGGATSTAMSVQAVAGLTRLQDLSLQFNAPSKTAYQDMLPLTSLRQLTRLDVNALIAWPLMTKVGPDQPPDVWLQLLERCAADSTCQGSIMRNHAQQLAEQQQDMEDLQQQLVEQQQYTADLQQQVTDLQQQLASQQQHNMELQEELRALQALVRGALLQRPIRHSCGCSLS